LDEGGEVVVDEVDDESDEMSSRLLVWGAKLERNAGVDKRRRGWKAIDAFRDATSRSVRRREAG
jgi:hypothetical protein